MFKNSNAFSSFSVDDLTRARGFYAGKLGIETDDTKEGLNLKLNGGGNVFIYPKGEGHEPASFTVLNFPVDDIDAAVDKLVEMGVTFQSYGGDIATDEKGIFRGGEHGHGPNIAWFKDPAGNILSIVEETAPVNK
jgi:catechol 2,3-dioxygenase-like lactoylglutathione lyase family enzyme